MDKINYKDFLEIKLNITGKVEKAKKENLWKMLLPQILDKVNFNIQ